MSALQWGSTGAVVNPDIKALVYGDAGVGKTLLCATMPRPFILSAESGLLSLNKQNLERVYGVNNPNITYDIPYATIKTVEDLDAAYQYFALNPQARQYFRSLCLDSLSEIAERILNNIKRTVKDPRQAYGEVIERVETRVREFRDLAGYHVLMTAKMEPMKSADGIVRWAPMMPGSKLGPNLPYFFDEVYRLGVNKTADGKKYRFLQTDMDLQYVAKDRSGRLDEIERPEMWYLIQKMVGG